MIDRLVARRLSALCLTQDKLADPVLEPPSRTRLAVTGYKNPVFFLLSLYVMMKVRETIKEIIEVKLKLFLHRACRRRHPRSFQKDCLISQSLEVRRVKVLLIL